MNDELRKWLGDYMANLDSLGKLGPDQAYAMPPPQNAPAYVPPQRQAPPVQMPVQPQIEQLSGDQRSPNVTGSLAVPLNTGELFARGMFSPREQRPLQSWGFGYRMPF